eukprot:jgi/Mesvir1/19722/Mv09978-RA.1
MVTTMDNPVTEEVLRNYIKEKDLKSIISSMAADCLREMPEDPQSYLSSLIGRKSQPSLHDPVDTCLSPSVLSPSVTPRHSNGYVVTISGIGPDTETKREILDYLNKELSLSTLFQKMADALVTQRPANPVGALQAMLTRLQKKMEQGEATDRPSPAGPEDVGKEEEGHLMEEENDSFEMSPRGDPFSRPTLLTNGGGQYFQKAPRRASVSAECLSEEDTSGEPSLPKYPKSEEARQRILAAVTSNILFCELDKAMQGQLADAVFLKEYAQGDVIIRQGEENNENNLYYIVDQGTCEIFVAKKDAQASSGEGEQSLGEKVQTVGPGGGFGELALMYCSPRAATVVAVTPVKVWAMERTTFRTLMVNSTSHKRRQHEEFLSRVPLLAHLSEEQRARMADVVKQDNFGTGDAIVKQGEIGNHFFIIVEGSAIATVCLTQATGGSDAASTTEKVVKVYGPGDYFGELALLTERPRAATVRAASPTTTICIDCAAFKRLLGPCSEVFRDNANKVHRMAQQ